MFLENVNMGKTLMDNAMIFHWKFKKIRKNCEAEFDIVYYERRQNVWMKNFSSRFEGFVAVFLDINFLIYNTLTICKR